VGLPLVVVFLSDRSIETFTSIPPQEGVRRALTVLTFCCRPLGFSESHLALFRPSFFRRYILPFFSFSLVGVITRDLLSRVAWHTRDTQTKARPPKKSAGARSRLPPGFLPTAYSFSILSSIEVAFAWASAASTDRYGAVFVAMLLSICSFALH